MQRFTHLSSVFHLAAFYSCFCWSSASGMILQSGQKPLAKHAEGSGRGHLKKGAAILNPLSLWHACKSGRDCTLPEAAAQQGLRGVASRCRGAVFCVHGEKQELCWEQCWGAGGQPSQAAPVKPLQVGCLALQVAAGSLQAHQVLTSSEAFLEITAK